MDERNKLDVNLNRNLLDVNFRDADLAYFIKSVIGRCVQNPQSDLEINIININNVQNVPISGAFLPVYTL